jgi:GT2 family glycosyltransferase
VVIPTYNRCRSLQRCLDSLRGQADAPLFEVVVVDDGCTDGTREMLAAYTAPFPLRWIASERGGPGAARNLGVASAQAPLVLFLDDDCEADARLLSRHAAAHRTIERAVIIGPMVRPARGRRRSWVLWEQEVLDKQYRAMMEGLYQPTPRQFYTANASMSRAEFLDAGGFDSAFKRAEDVEFGYRLWDAGVRFAFHPGAVVTHYAERSLAAWWKVPYQYGVYDVRMWRDKGRRGMLDLIRHEFPKRNSLLRSVVRFAAGHERRSRAVAGAALAVAAATGEMGVFRIARPCYSVAFNLMYYQGVAEELGTDAIFRSLIGGRAVDITPP